MFWSDLWQSLTFILYLANILLVVYTCISLFLRKEDPIKTISWMVVLILLPYIGIILYILVGRNLRKEKIFNRKGARDLKVRERICSDMLESFKNEENIPSELLPFSKIVIQNLKTSQSIVTYNKEVSIFFTGKEALEAMYHEMEEAKAHIHLQSFIIDDDEIGNKFKELLIKKAKEGVEVRVMFDGFGSRSLRKQYVQELKNAGVEVLIFSPFRWLFPTPVVNYRNHRKILVIDGITGFLGGINIADRYVNGGEFHEWRDTHIKLTGESVYSLQASFLLDRYFILNKNITKRNKYYPDFSFALPKKRDDDQKYYLSQIISSGPDSDWSSIMQCYFTAITQAKHSIHIITPYFIPTSLILNAIKIAALSNVRVSLMIPEKSDTWLTNWGTMSYISELLEAGVHIYLFKKGFNHSKVLSIDGEYCIIGSANMDNRSFEHHFEVTSILYNQECARTIDERFQKDLKRCSLVTSEIWRKRTIQHRLYESVARLLSPLL